MKEAARLAGFVASHAILCVWRGNCLTIPLVVLEKEDGSTQFIEVTGTSSQEAVERAGRLLRSPGQGVQRAVMAFEAYLNLPPGKTDAIFVQACQYQPQVQELYLAVPFRAVKSPGGFAVFRPKFFAYEDEPPRPELLTAFMQGIPLHPPGHEVWMKHLDESR
jgi:hypothetical protein